VYVVILPPTKTPNYFSPAAGCLRNVYVAIWALKKPPNFFRLRRAVSEMCVRPFETSKPPPMRIQFSLHDVRIINYNENLLKLLVNKKIIGLIANECPRARKFFKRKRVPPRENLDGAQV
jgi:hypothetical protein